ncbi:hypothetical protein [Actinophytocola sp.]|uniref:hypothetical protein n=1 Tax=Actinophytocola sp. TaxID=1872138 RepID=UPI002D24A27D|nr:hypothetical protein [Actinophytocola sp.]HYQ69054.1 hypothetical protein [Actinophytocola sp.]
MIALVVALVAVVAFVAGLVVGAWRYGQQVADRLMQREYARPRTTQHEENDR